MIPHQAFLRIKELLALTGPHRISQRKIALQVGVSRGTVGAIASGRRTDYLTRLREKKEEDERLPDGPRTRCPTCGAAVYGQCRACRLRERLRRVGLECEPDGEKFRISELKPAAAERILKTDLHGEEKKTYARVKKAKQQAGEAQAADYWSEPQHCSADDPQVRATRRRWEETADRIADVAGNDPGNGD